MNYIDLMQILDANLASSNVLENENPAWNSGETYAIDALVNVVGMNTHDVYKSLVANNIGNVPASSPTKWQLIGKTNRWSMFDRKINTQTTNLNTIDFTLNFTNSVVSGLALLNISAASVQIIMTSTLEGVVYDQSFSLISNSGITDIIKYCFSPIKRRTAFAITNLPLYANGTIRIILQDPGNIVRCGVALVGQTVDVGDSEWGLSLSVDDYSRRVRDAFGNLDVVEGDCSRRQDVTLEVNTTDFDYVIETFEARRAKLTVYIGAERFTSSILYGFYEGYTQIATNAAKSKAQIHLIGMI